MNKWLLTMGLVGAAGQVFAAVDATPPTVTASPKSGTYSIAQSIKLAIKDNVDAAPVVYYTTDGTLPNKKSAIYKSQPINATDVKKSGTDLYVKTLAYDARGNVVRNTFSYKIISATADVTAPVVTASVKAGSYTSAQNITLSVKDDTDTAPVIYYTTDSSLPSKSSPVYKSGAVLKATDKGDGVDLRIRTLAYDASGNAVRNTFNYQVEGAADTQAPVATASVAPGTYSSSQTVKLTVSDNQDKAAKLYYTLDGSEPTSSSTLYSGTTFTLASSTTIKVLAVDATGNKQSYSFAYVISAADTQAPVVAPSLPAGSYSGTQSLTLSVTDDKDAAPKLYYTLDGSEPTANATAYTAGKALALTAGTASTTITVKVLALDVSGNKQVYSFVYTLEPKSTDTWYFRGTPNNWGKTAMTQSGALFCLTQAFGAVATDPRFKIDHKGDWTENYPAADVKVKADTTYKVCIDPASKAVTSTEEGVDPGKDVTPPTVAATPAAGSYTDTQFIGLSISDAVDKSPKLYYTTDGNEPTTASTLYTNQTLSATDKVKTGADLTVKTLAVDASGNQVKNTFTYYIGDNGSTITGDFRSETIYFVLTARFNDGDPSNNYYNRDRYKEGDPQWRGDFKGLIEQLDYIKDLGFTAIWVTPPVENRSGLDFHGYHAYDWYKIDPRLESPDATYQDLINAAHKKGLKIIQDVVINHSSQYGIRDKVWIDHLPVKYYVEKGSTQGKIKNGPYLGNLGDYKSVNRDDNDNAVAPAWFQALHNSDPEGVVPFTDPTTGAKVPDPNVSANRFFGIDPGKLDPQWFHLDGYMSGGDWENTKSLQRKHMAGDCIDLATENQNVKEYMNGAIHKYLDMGVDAIRLDTAKHIERNELLTYTHDWQAHKPGLFIFGEVLVKGAGFGSEITNDNASADIRPWWYTRTGSDKAKPSGDSKLSVFDFPLFSTFRDNVTKGSFGGIKGILDMDYTYADPTQLVTFFQNHDVGPDNDFKYRYGGEVANAAMAYNLLWTVRGIPALYYGEEIMFQAGLPEDLASANDTLDQTGRAYYGPKLADKATTQAHPLYQHIKRLNQIRKAIPALQKGAMQNVNEWGNGMSFARDSGDSYVVVGLTSGSSQTITVKGVKAGTYKDAVTGKEISASGGNLTFTVNPYSVGAYVLNGPGKVGADGQWLK